MDKDGSIFNELVTALQAASARRSLDFEESAANDLETLVVSSGCVGER